MCGRVKKTAESACTGGDPRISTHCISTSEVENGNTEIARFPLRSRAPTLENLNFADFFLKSQGQNDELCDLLTAA